MLAKNLFIFLIFKFFFFSLIATIDGLITQYYLYRFLTNTTHRITFCPRATLASSCWRCHVTLASPSYGKSSNTPYISVGPLTLTTMREWPWQEKSWWTILLTPVRTRRISTAWNPTEKSWIQILVLSKL